MDQERKVGGCCAGCYVNGVADSSCAEDISKSELEIQSLPHLLKTSLHAQISTDKREENGNIGRSLIGYWNTLRGIVVLATGIYVL